MDDTPDEGEGGATEGVPAAAQLDDFVWDAILLGGEGEGSSSSHTKFRVGGGVKVETGGSNEELDIAQGEWLCVGF